MEVLGGAYKAVRLGEATASPILRKGEMSEQIIIALITAGLPVLATIITTIVRGRASAKHSAKQSILQMILEDHIAVNEGQLPTNYQNVLHEYDIYHKNGGNTYITERVEEYKRWFLKIQAESLDK